MTKPWTELNYSNDGESPQSEKAFNALRAGDRFSFAKALANGAKPKWKDSFGRTLIHMVADKGDEFFAEELEKLSPDWSSDGEFMDTSAFLAAARRGIDGYGALRIMVETSLRRGLDMKREEGRTALYGAADSGSVEVVEYLLSKGFSPNADCFGWRPLHAAVKKGSLEAMAALVGAGADLEARTEGGDTAFMLALDRYKVECAEALLDFGANPYAVRGDGSTAFSLACRAGSERLALLILDGTSSQKEDWDEALRHAASYGMKDLLVRLLECGANPNAEDFDKLPALDCALRTGKEECAVILLRAGADPFGAGEDFREIAISMADSIRLADGLKKSLWKDGAIAKASLKKKA